LFCCSFKAAGYSLARKSASVGTDLVTVTVLPSTLNFVGKLSYQFAQSALRDSGDADAPLVARLPKLIAHLSSLARLSGDCCV
jgi:hypothetical protein